MNISWRKASIILASGLANAIGESVRDERMKANMITNISHDIKTPLTSIIQLYRSACAGKKSIIASAESYIEVLESKAMRLKQLMEDLLGCVPYFFRKYYTADG